MSWPAPAEYCDAVQFPDISFLDPDLTAGQVVKNALGVPLLPVSGGFGAVFEFECPNAQKWAVKCFTRDVPRREERYHSICKRLVMARIRNTVDCSYHAEGVKTLRGEWFPILKMRWIKGKPLNQFVREHLGRPETLEALLEHWVELARTVRAAKVAHGDLYHGNVLLVQSGNTPDVVELKLVDYDGMWVPELAEVPSGENGHEHYQHPDRLKRGIYNIEVDRFPNLLICTALKCLVIGGRELWGRHDNGENLLFSKEDFEDPGNSQLLRELWNANDVSVHSLVGQLVLASQGPLGREPQVWDLLGDGRSPRLERGQEREVDALLHGRARPRSTFDVSARAPTDSSSLVTSPGRTVPSQLESAEEIVGQPIAPARVPKKPWLPVMVGGVSLGILIGVLSWTLTPRDAAKASYNRGEAYRLKVDYDRAIVEYSEAIRLKPDDVTAYRSRDEAIQRKEEYERPIEPLTKAIPLAPRFASPSPPDSAGRSRPDSAGPSAPDSVGRATPDSVKPSMQDSAGPSRRDTAGRSTRDPVRSSAPDLAGPSILDSAEPSRRDTAGTSTRDPVSSSTSDAAETYKNRGDMHRHSGDFDRAIADYTEAIRLKPYYAEVFRSEIAEAYKNRGDVHLRKQDFHQAITDYTEAVRFKPYFGEAYNNRGLAYTHIGERYRAVADFKKAERHMPRADWDKDN